MVTFDRLAGVNLTEIVDWYLKEICMSKSHDAKKTSKKKPEKTLKEKRLEKKEKKASR